MRIVTPFDPIETGTETDVFVFDFTTDVGGATPVSTTWTCALAPGTPNPSTVDPNPAARVISEAVQTSLTKRLPDNTIQTLVGVFSTALIGNFPASAAGATYVIDAELVLSDGRKPHLNANLPCVAPGS